MNSNNSENYGLTWFQLNMHVVEIPKQVHVYIFQYLIVKIINQFENLDCSYQITVLYGCHLFTVSLTFH